MGPVLMQSADCPETHWHMMFHLPLVLLHQGWHAVTFLTAGYLQQWGITWGAQALPCHWHAEWEVTVVPDDGGKLNSLDIIKSCQDAMHKTFASLLLQT